ncbi:unnamed protein product [Oppiella nova]|uniref:Ribosome maturation factor RimP n=1 Tax=Oppiella nova TaxID=334625 RepID=A0A7R9LB47_9ACAR|nr:unnamed protein product [Oppiella nova]CAG2159517.1 unnamed protein product [Oppiella nova]
MKLSNKTQALQDLITPAVQACDVELWGIEFIPQGKRSLLRIYIDKDVVENAEPTINEDGEAELGRGIGVQDCVRVTQQVGEYALEVSSPGWDRPFFQLAQLEKYIGQQVALRLIAAVENRRKFQAKLIAVDLENEFIQVEVEKQQVLEIDSNNIDKANLIFQD